MAFHPGAKYREGPMHTELPSSGTVFLDGVPHDAQPTGRRAADGSDIVLLKSRSPSPVPEFRAYTQYGDGALLFSGATSSRSPSSGGNSSRPPPPANKPSHLCGNPRRPATPSGNPSRPPPPSGNPSRSPSPDKNIKQPEAEEDDEENYTIVNTELSINADGKANCRTVAYFPENNNEPLQYSDGSFKTIYEAVDEVSRLFDDHGVDLSRLPRSVHEHLLDLGVKDSAKQQIMLRTVSRAQDGGYRLSTHYFGTPEDLCHDMAFKTMLDLLNYIPSWPVEKLEANLDRDDDGQVIIDDAFFLHPDATPLSIIHDAAAAEELRKTLAPDGNEPETKTDGNEPETKTDGNEPETKTDGNEPETKTDGNEPETKTEGNEPETKTEGSEIGDDLIKLSKAQFWSFLDNINDAVSGEPVTKDTSLVELHGARNLSMPTLPDYPAQFVRTTNGREDYSPRFEKIHGEFQTVKPTGLTMRFRFVGLTTNPCVRVVLQYKDIEQSPVPLEVAAIDFPWSHDNCPMTRDSFKHHHGPHDSNHYYVYNFEWLSNGAMPAYGVKNLKDLRPKFSTADQTLLDYFLDFVAVQEDGYKQMPEQAVHVRVWQLKRPMSRKDEAELLKLEPELQAEAKQKYADAPVMIDAKMEEILKHMPGGDSSVDEYIPDSFTSPEYMPWMNTTFAITMRAGALMKPFNLIKRTHPSPMTDMPYSNIFQSILEARLKLGYAIHYEFMQHKVAFAQLAKLKHYMWLCSFGDIFVAGIRFADFSFLGYTNSSPPHISDGTNVDLKWTGSSGHPQKARGVVIQPPGYMPNAQISVLLHNRSTKSFTSSKTKYESNATDADEGRAPKRTGMAKAWEDKSSATREEKEAFLHREYQLDELLITPNESVYKADIMTISKLTSQLGKKWHRHLLNRQPYDEDSLPRVDSLIDGIEYPAGYNATSWKARVDKVHQEMLGYKPADRPDFTWNAAQREAIEELRHSIGRMILVLGAGGTGKTHLQMVLCVFLRKLGFHILYDAPANSNIEDFAKRMNEVFPDQKFVRVVPLSAEHGLQRMSTNIEDLNDEPSQGDFRDGPVFQLLNGQLKAKHEKFEPSRDHHLQAQVVAEAFKDPAERMTQAFTYAEEEDAQDEDFDEQGENAATYYRRRGLETQAPLDPLPIDFDTALAWADGPTAVALPRDWQKKKNPDSDNTCVYIYPPLKLVTRSEPGDDCVFDAFTELRHFIDAAVANPIRMWFQVDANGDALLDIDGQPMPDKEAANRFRSAYRKCHKTILARATFICTTSASATGKLVRNTWASGKLGGPKVVGVAIIRDEVAKDTEAHFWGPIVNGCWAQHVAVVVACGDLKQLSPTVTGEKRFNPFFWQLHRSFLSRMIGEGRHHVFLSEQARMHPTIAQFVCNWPYEGKLSTAKHRNVPLDEDVKNECLIPLMLTKNGTGSVGIGHKDVDLLSDNLLRLQAFVGISKAKVNNTNGSRTNPGQIAWATQVLLPAQSKYFGKDTRNKCLWIAGYKDAIHSLDQIFSQYAHDNNVSREHLPLLCTIDSAQGREAYWVVFLTIVDQEKALGFMKDDLRMTVALTRATDILYVVASKWIKGDEIPDVDPGLRAGPMLPWFLKEQRGKMRTKTVFFPEIKDEDLPYTLR